MKALGTVIHTLLTGNGDINTLTSGNIYPNIVPQNIEKDTYIVYSVQDVATNNCQIGQVINAVYSFFIASPSYEVMDGLCENVMNLFNHYQGTVNNINVVAIIYLQESDDFVFEERLHAREQEYRITIFQTI